MKVVFLTNQASYHQMHYARAMVNLLGADSFRIVFQKPTSESRAEMGWTDEFTEPYIIRFWQSDASTSEACRWIDQADVVIQGRFPIKYVRQRIEQGKLTFACQERLWKKRPSLARKISRIGHLYKNYYSLNKSNYHFLAIGAYAAQDLNDMGIFLKRSWRFGYFIDVPEQRPYPSERDHIELLWCARLSAVKQPQRALQIVKGLIDQGVKAKLTMIGDGHLKTQLQQNISQLSLSKHVKMLGWQTQEEVFEAMRGADLFLMTSHHGEGWGLVVNEAMSNGCGVVANRELGSAACLIDDGVTGFLYDGSDIDELVERIANSDQAQIASMGLQSRERMSALWSATIAASRSIELFEALLVGNDLAAKSFYSEGPYTSIG